MNYDFILESNELHIKKLQVMITLAYNCHKLSMRYKTQLKKKNGAEFV